MKSEALIKAWEEGRLILLPVPLGTTIWRVHRAFIPKDGIHCNWESVWTYDKEEYSLEHYKNNKDVFYSEEAARNEIIERMKGEIKCQKE